MRFGRRLIATSAGVTISTAIQRYAGGSKPFRIILQVISPWTFRDKGLSKQTGKARLRIEPRIYIPASIHPHFGSRLEAFQLTAQSKVNPAKGRMTKFRSSWSKEWADTSASQDGSQKHTPPNTVQ